MQYRVLPGCTWVTLKRIYKTGETVELPPHEGNPFVGKVLEVVIPEPAAPEPAKVPPRKGKQETL